MQEKTLIHVRAGDVVLKGDLAIPSQAKGIVLFAHGSGSSRSSPRNQFVASSLNKAGIATLLIDLLTEEEEALDDVTGELRFNIPFLAQRLIAITDAMLKGSAAKHLELGYFGASTGAAAALMAAAAKGDKIAAVVSRGGRPDLALSVLGGVMAPTLLIVGELDTPVIEMNEEALAALRSEKKLVIVPKATHLFEEKGALEEVARLSSAWFLAHF